MLDFVKSLDITGIIVFVISAGIFRALITVLSKNNPEIFSFVKEIPDSLKGKWYIRWGVFMVLILILSVSVVYLRLNGNASWVIAGFISAFTDFIFFKPDGGNISR